MADKAKKEKRDNSGEIWDLKPSFHPLGEAELRWRGEIIYATPWFRPEVLEWITRHPEPFPTRPKGSRPDMGYTLSSTRYSQQRNEQDEENSDLAKKVLMKAWDQEGVDAAEQVDSASYDLAMATVKRNDPKWIGARLADQAKTLNGSLQPFIASEPQGFGAFLCLLLYQQTPFMNPATQYYTGVKVKVISCISVAIYDNLNLDQ